MNTAKLDSARDAFIALARHHKLFTSEELDTGKTDPDEAARLLNVVLRGVASTVPAPTALRFALGANEAGTMREYLDKWNEENPSSEPGADRKPGEPGAFTTRQKRLRNHRQSPL